MSSGIGNVSIWPMHTMQQQLLQWTNIPILITVYYVYKITHRLYFSPLSHIPGPKLAGMSIFFQSIGHSYDRPILQLVLDPTIFHAIESTLISVYSCNQSLLLLLQCHL